MTTEQLAPIKARVEAATPGPWQAAPMCELFSINCKTWDPSLWGCVYPGKGFREGTEADAKFKAHAREDVPALVAEVERLQSFAGIHPGLSMKKENQELKAEAASLREALADVGIRIADSDCWWMDDPSRGGFDLDRIERVLKLPHSKAHADRVAKLEVLEAVVGELKPMINPGGLPTALLREPWSKLIEAYDAVGEKP